MINYRLLERSHTCLGKATGKNSSLFDLISILHLHLINFIASRSNYEIIVCIPLVSRFERVFSGPIHECICFLI